MSNPGWEYSDAQCPLCCQQLRSQSCWLCLGAGQFNLYEEDPIAHAPGAHEDCSECQGVGSITWCICGYVRGVTDD